MVSDICGMNPYNLGKECQKFLADSIAAYCFSLYLREFADRKYIFVCTNTEP